MFCCIKKNNKKKYNLQKIYDLIDVDGNNKISQNDDISELGKLIKLKKIKELEIKKKQIEFSIQNIQNKTPYRIILDYSKKNKFDYDTLLNLEQELSKEQWENLYTTLKKNEINRLQRSMKK